MLEQAIRYFLPHHAKAHEYDAAHLDQYRKDRLATIIAIALLVPCLPYALMFGWLGAMWSAFSMILGMFMYLATLFSLQRFAASNVASVLIVLALMNNYVLISWETGGNMSSVTYAFVMLPIVGLLIGSKRLCLIALALIIALFAGFSFVAESGYVFPHLIPPNARNIVDISIFAAVTALGTVMLIAFENGRVETQANLAKEQAATRGKVDEAIANLAAQQKIQHDRDEQLLRDSEAQRQELERGAESVLAAMQRFASGDLTASVDVQSTTIVGKIASGFNAASEQMRTLVAQVQESVQNTSKISQHISKSSNDVASTAEQQVKQTAHIASAVEEVARTVAETAHTTTEAALLAQKSGAEAQHGERVVAEAVAKIHEIARVVQDSATIVQRLGDSSAEIGEIVQVIEEIADQTNLLALNAAIEAARAGDQGRGFAVVADEVRKLAERTAQATKQIGATIRQIQKETDQAVKGIQRGNTEVREGLSLAEQAGKALSGIVASVNEVQSLVRSVAAASEQQATTSENVAQSVEAISMSVEQSTFSINDVARSAEQMQNVTAHLERLTSRFNAGERASLSSSQSRQISRRASPLLESKNSADVFFRNKYIVIAFNRAENLVEGVWTSATAQMRNAEFQECVTQFAKAAEAHHPHGLYIDALENTHVVTPELGAWHDAEIAPRYIAAGVRKLGFLAPAQAITQSSTEDIFEADTAKSAFEVRFFSEEKKLREWLRG
jgi:methyl-accepting chemotaxis protein